MMNPIIIPIAMIIAMMDEMIVAIVKTIIRILRHIRLSLNAKGLAINIVAI